MKSKVVHDVIDIAPKYKALIPNILLGYTLEVSLETNRSIANAIRRVLLDDLEVYRLSPALIDVVTTDTSVISEELIPKFNQLTLKQDLINPNDKFSLFVENKTTNRILVTTNDIMDSKGKSIAGTITSGDVIITSLLPLKSITISNIPLVKSNGRTNGCFQLMGPIGFEDNLSTASSLQIEPTSYSMSIYCNGELKPDDVIRNAVSWLIKHLKSTAEVLKTVISEIEGSKTEFILEVLNEEYTIGNIIVYYIYEVYNEIPFVTLFVPRNIHAFRIKIKIKQSILQEVITKAIDKAIMDLQKIF
jgi:DNA-directed RNA polymerase subunit L